jgi:hypothetical protein
MIWGAAAVIEEAYDSLNMFATGLFGVRLPAQFLERQRDPDRERVEMTRIELPSHAS